MSVLTNDTTVILGLQREECVAERAQIADHARVKAAWWGEERVGAVHWKEKYLSPSTDAFFRRKPSALTFSFTRPWICGSEEVDILLA